MKASTHCGGSNLYRRERIPSHTAQFRATILVLKYLAERYTYRTLQRHTEQVGIALAHLELKLHEEVADDHKI